MGRLIEGFWDCPYCDKKHIRGLTTVCPNCDTPRGDMVKFYMDDPNNVIEEEQAKKISKNPDWLCDFCLTLNNDDFSECQNCGAPKDKSKMNYFENRQKVDMQKAKRNQQNLAPQQEFPSDRKSISQDQQPYRNTTTSSPSVNDSYQQSKTQRNTYNPKPKAPQKKKAPKILAISAIALVAVLLLTGLISLFIPKEQSGTVDSFAWEYSIAVEEYKTFQESDWSLPPGARLSYSQQEIKGYERVLDHYETKTRTYTEQVLDHYETVVTGYKDNGNGTFSEITSQQPVYRTETKTETYQEPVYRDEPIYATKYYYEIDRWAYKKSIKTSADGKEPYWGTYSFSTNEREGSRTETYKITIITEEDERKEYTVDKDVWNKLQKGDTVKLKVYITGHADLITD